MPELTEDLLAPLVRYIRSDINIRELNTLIPSGGTNPILGPPINIMDSNGDSISYPGSRDLWVFRGFALDGSPSAHIEGTGSSAITLEQGSAWSPKARGKSVEYPTVEVYYHCDVTRSTDIGAPLMYDARDKCLTLHKYVSKLLHIRNGSPLGFHYLGAKPDGSNPLKVITSYEGQGLRISPVLDGDGMVEGRASFEMEVFL